ncbi:MAG: hypothetical protein DRG76_01935 [Deltaproteobacteria bacterium]|nr:MAG: hypothetical protein DRG76_01935 [Deltaproteobacteria bacterium]
MNIGDTRILVVDDDPEILDIVSSTLSICGYHIETCDSSRKSLLMLNRKDFDLVLLDIIMPEMDGIQIASHMKNNLFNQEIIIITGEPDQKKIDACREIGIYNFLFKPFSAQQLEYTVYAALYSKRMRDRLKEQIKDNPKSFRIIGISKWARHLRDQVRTIAKSELPVLITGETGTGKELIAKDIHDHSQRKDKPFLPINCATLGSLAESELFGHVAGAFTGATRTTRGYIGSADGGTLFLDEIGELPLPLQAKLLRFLDSGEYLRVGDSKIRTADVRIISATNRDLLSLCKKGEFREDLYYRITGVKINTLPLREHTEDIPMLVWHFIEKLAEKQGRTFTISGDAIVALKDYDWPGNVRQLKHTIFLLCEQAPDGQIDLPSTLSLLEFSPNSFIEPYQKAKEKAIKDFELKYFSQVLACSKGSLKRALELTSLHKKNFYTKIKALGLSNKQYSPKWNAKNAMMWKYNPAASPKASKIPSAMISH